MARGGADEGTCVIALNDRRRGRHGKRGLRTRRRACVSIIACTSAGIAPADHLDGRRAVHELGWLSPDIKWVNDVFDEKDLPTR